MRASLLETDELETDDSNNSKAIKYIEPEHRVYLKGEVIE